MIDFRYHVVSLVAVFIALAVGIVLGAGPLREGISDTLEGEVSQLRSERADLRAALGAATSRAENKEEAVEAVADRAAAGALTGARVAFVALPGADRNQMAELQDAVEAAGGTVQLTARVDEVAEEAPDEDNAALIAELAFQLQLPVDGDEATFPNVLAAAVAGQDPAGAQSVAEQALVALDEAGLLNLTWDGPEEVESDGDSPATSVVVLSGDLEFTEEGALEEDDQVVLDTRLDLIEALASLGTATVVAGIGAETGADLPEHGQNPLVYAIRNENALADDVSTVDNVESAAGRLAVPLALSWELDDESGHYGIAANAEAPLPAPPPVRLPSRPPGDDAQVTEPVPDPGDGSQVTEPAPDPAGSTTSPGS